jgi:outer membrane protein assembly factor BamD
MTIHYAFQPRRSQPARKLAAALLAVALAILAGCAGGGEERAQQGTAEVIYERGRKAMDRGNYREAIFIFEQLESRFPFSELGKQSQIDLIYCYYKNSSQEQAIDAADQFIRENPTHPRVDYALYIKGLTYFDRDPGPLESLLKVDRATRPPADSERAFSLFRQLVERFPASPYAADAVERMEYLREKLARYENYVADYYIRRGAYIAALNRAKRALTRYNGTSANRRSLEIMIEAYDRLEMSELAASTRRVLDANFP